ncbi:unnamed protein product [Calicophoron daubneyi]|uniref:Uncharacterized protein n=1 Tax=Calicophoron daubneyi TaxID=300641 RepID=A0AAV2TMI6_CALDB
MLHLDVLCLLVVFAVVCSAGTAACEPVSPTCFFWDFLKPYCSKPRSSEKREDKREAKDKKDEEEPKKRDDEDESKRRDDEDESKRRDDEDESKMYEDEEERTPRIPPRRPYEEYMRPEERPYYPYPQECWCYDYGMYPEHFFY